MASTDLTNQVLSSYLIGLLGGSWAASSTFILAATLTCIPLMYKVAQWLLSTARPVDYPPGPPTRLGFGNVHQLPRTFHYLQLHAWAKEYGPIMGLKLGAQNLVVLNDASIFHELFTKRATSFSERAEQWIPQNHVLPEGADTYTLFMRPDYNQNIRSSAKHLIAGAGLSNLAPMQKARATHLVLSLLHEGERWEQNLKRWTVSTPAAMFCGVPIEDFLDSYGEQSIEDYYNSQELFVPLASPLNPAANTFPMLRWVPSILAPWKRKAPIARKTMLDAYDAIITQAEKGLHRHGGTFSAMALIPRLLRSAPDIFTSKEEGIKQKIFLGGFFDSATGSSFFAFRAVILAMAAHADVQRKAHAEVDNIFGDKALPERIELDKLPYISACVTEAQRWRPPTAFVLGAFGLPRTAVRDEEVLGYRIPKGSWVLLNQWTLAHDPDVYEQPDRYDPDRYIRNSLGVKDNVSGAGRKPIYSFGAGRRECAGKDYFFQNVRIALAQILWAFDITPAGPLDVDAQTGFLPDMVMTPMPFKVNFVLRRPEEILEAEKRKADEKLHELLG